MKRLLRGNTEQLLVVWSIILCLVLSFSFADAAISEQSGNGIGISFSDFSESQKGVVFDGEGVVDFVFESSADMPGIEEPVSSLRSLVINGTEIGMAEESIIREPGNSVMTIDDVAIGSTVGYVLDPGNRIRRMWILSVEAVVERERSKGEHEAPSMSTPLPKDIKNVNGVWVN